MPEGDTIYRAAAMMDRTLGGAILRAFESPRPPLNRFADSHQVVGRAIERVEARGKYLLVHIAGALTLLTHLRMNGSWHLYRPGERWRRPRGDMRARLVTGDRSSARRPPVRRSEHNAFVGSRCTAVRIRARRQAVSPLRHADSVPARGQKCAIEFLVPGVPADGKGSGTCYRFTAVVVISMSPSRSASPASTVVRAGYGAGRSAR